MNNWQSLQREHLGIFRWRKKEMFFTSKSRSKMLPAREAKLQEPHWPQKASQRPAPNLTEDLQQLKGH